MVIKEMSPRTVLSVWKSRCPDPSLQQQIRSDLVGVVGAAFFHTMKSTALCPVVLRTVEQPGLTHR